MRISFIKLLPVLFAVIIQSAVFGQTKQFSVSGTITDSHQNPLIGASVFVKGTYNGASTNVDGTFTIQNVKEPTAVLVASYLGFQTIEKTITVSKNVTDVKLALSAEGVTMKQDLVITANRAKENTPIAFQDLDSTYISDNNIGLDLPLVLDQATSVVSSSDAGNGVGYSSMRIRGSDATRVNVTINGIPFNDPESQGTFFVNLPDITSSANDIQIQRGVGTSTNGAGAFGASVNINTTELTKEAYGKYTLGLGSFNTLRNTLAFGTGLMKSRFSVDGRLSLISSDGYIDRAASNLKSYYVKAGYYGKKMSLKFITFGGNERTYQAWYGVPQEFLDTARTFNPYTYNDQVDDYSQTHYQLHFNYNLSTYWKASVSGFAVLGKGFYEEYKGSEFNPVIGGSREDLADYGMAPVIIGSDTITETNLIRQKWLDNVFTGGLFNLTYTKGAIDAVFGGGFTHYSGEHFGEIIWSEYASSSQKGDRYYYNKGVKKDWNLYGKVNWQANDKFNVFVDLQVRQVNYSINGVDSDQRILQISDQNTVLTQKSPFFNPKAGLTYEINNQNKAYASFAVANHEPNRGDYIDAPLGVTPSHETLYDYELGYAHSDNKWLFNANAYYMQYDNQLVLTGAVNDVGGAIRQNVENSYRLGIELEAGIKITEKIVWSVNATFSQNKISNFTQYVDDWYNGGQSQYELKNTDIAFSPSVIAGSVISYKSKLFTDTDEVGISLISKYVGSQYFDNTQSEQRKLDAYFTNDVRLTYQVAALGLKKLSFNFTARNIINTLYISNAWAYTFHDPSNYSDGDIYVNDVNDSGRKQMAGYFPQAQINYIFGLTLNF